MIEVDIHRKLIKESTTLTQYLKRITSTYSSIILFKLRSCMSKYIKGAVGKECHSHFPEEETEPSGVM